MTIAPPRPAWDGLVELRPALERYLASRCQDPHEVDDAVQESLVRAASFRARRGQPASLQAWLLRIGANVLADRVRRARRRATERFSDELAHTLSAPGPAPEEACDEAELDCGGVPVPLGRARRAIDGALGSLPEHDRTVLSGFYLDGLPRLELARRLGVDPEVVKVRLFRARRRLRSALRRRLEVAA